MPGEDPVALVLVGGLGERARARHSTPAHVEPVTRQPPLRSLSHRILLRNQGFVRVLDLGERAVGPLPIDPDLAGGPPAPSYPDISASLYWNRKA